MGHATRNANRAAGIADNKGKINEVRRVMKDLVGEWKIHVKDHKGADEAELLWRAALTARIDEVEERVLFNALPFWKRWWSRLYWWWQERKKDNETLKDVMKPPFIEAAIIDPEGGPNTDEGATNESATE